MHNDFHGFELLRIWEAGRPNGLSQRKMAALLGLNFDAMHGKLFRAQKVLDKGEQKLNVYNEPARVMLKAAVYDIETTSFKAGGINDHLVCVSILPLDKDEPINYSIKFSDNRDDKRLLLEVIDALKEYDILVGHNVTSFDSLWLASRLAYHGLPFPDHKWLVYDTYQAARRMSIKAERKSLAMLCDFFKLEFTKTAVYPVSWSMVDSPTEAEFDKAIADITFHCNHDVKSNRKLFDALWPLDKTLQSLPVSKKL